MSRRLPAVLRALWPRHLRQQLVCVVSLALVVALGMLGSYTATEQAAIAHRGQENQAAALARNVAISGANFILTDSLDQLEALVLHSADFDEVISVKVLDLQGRVISHVARASGQKPRLVFAALKDRQALPEGRQPSVRADVAHDRIIAWQPVLSGAAIAWVEVVYNVEALHQAQRLIWRNTLVVSVLAVSLFAGCWWSFCVARWSSWSGRAALPTSCPMPEAGNCRFAPAPLNSKSWTPPSTRPRCSCTSRCW